MCDQMETVVFSTSLAFEDIRLLIAELPAALAQVDRTASETELEVAARLVAGFKDLPFWNVLQSHPRLAEAAKKYPATTKQLAREACEQERDDETVVGRLAGVLVRVFSVAHMRDDEPDAGAEMRRVDVYDNGGAPESADVESGPVFRSGRLIVVDDSTGKARLNIDSATEVEDAVRELEAERTVRPIRLDDPNGTARLRTDSDDEADARDAEASGAELRSVDPFDNGRSE